MKPKVSPEIVLAHVRRSPNLSNKEVGKVLGISEASVRRALDTVEYTRPRLSDPRITIERPLRIKADRPIDITADYHFPLARYDLIERLLEDAETEGCKVLAIAGDLFHADTPSSFDYKQDSADMGTEKRTGTEFVDAAAEVYDEIIIGWGNHDARYQKRLNYGVDFVTTMKMMLEACRPETKEKIRWTNLDHFYLYTGEEREQLWYVCHPKSYSSVPLTQSRRIASKELCNVVTAHSHHHAAGHDISGRFTCAEIGGYFDRTITEYLQRSTSFPNWQNGAGRLYPNNLFEMRSEAWIRR